MYWFHKGMSKGNTLLFLEGYGVSYPSLYGNKYAGWFSYFIQHIYKFLYTQQLIWETDFFIIYIWPWDKQAQECSLEIATNICTWLGFILYKGEIYLLKTVQGKNKEYVHSQILPADCWQKCLGFLIKTIF